jgi:hypothetical protein
MQHRGWKLAAPDSLTVRRLDDARGPTLVVLGAALLGMVLVGVQLGGEAPPPLASLVVGPRYAIVPLVLVAVLAATVGAVGRWEPAPGPRGARRSSIAGLASFAWFVVAALVFLVIAAVGLLALGADATIHRSDVAAVIGIVVRLGLTSFGLGMLTAACVERRPGARGAAIPLLLPFGLELVAGIFVHGAGSLPFGGSWALLAAGDAATASVSVPFAVVAGTMAVAWIGLPFVALLVAAWPRSHSQ